jgi:hypothetical protein
MKPKILLRCALLAFFIALGVLVAGWDGTSSISVAWPVSGSVVQLSGSAKGWHAIAGLAGFLAAVVLFLWGLISLATGGRRKAGKEPLPEPPVSQVKRESASQ